MVIVHARVAGSVTLVTREGQVAAVPVSNVVLSCRMPSGSRRACSRVAAVYVRHGAPQTPVQALNPSPWCPGRD